jgi:hypothetical protein
MRGSDYLSAGWALHGNVRCTDFDDGAAVFLVRPWVSDLYPVSDGELSVVFAALFLLGLRILIGSMLVCDLRRCLCCFDGCCQPGGQFRLL